MCKLLHEELKSRDAMQLMQIRVRVKVSVAPPAVCDMHAKRRSVQTWSSSTLLPDLLPLQKWSCRRCTYGSRLAASRFCIHKQHLQLNHQV